MTNYPGTQILYEYGTRKELAASYGVSERTIYRWMSKARAESGEKPSRPRRPRMSTLENFTGTRAELAKKYNISERTVYRWLNKARESGFQIASRARKTAYPGNDILSETGSNRQIGERYGVSEATIRRWKKKASAAGMPEEVITPDQLPEEIFTPDQLPEEIFTPDMLPEEIITEEQEPEQSAVDEDANLLILNNFLLDNDQLVEDSLFLTFDKLKRVQYLNAYIEYQSDLDPGQFYDKEIHDFNYSPDFVSTINIWGDTFETWLSQMESLEQFGSEWLDDL